MEKKAFFDDQPGVCNIIKKGLKPFLMIEKPFLMIRFVLPTLREVGKQYLTVFIAFFDDSCASGLVWEAFFNDQSLF